MPEAAAVLERVESEEQVQAAESAVSFRSSGLWLYYRMLGFFHGVGSDSIKLSDRNAADLEKQVLASIVRDIFIH